jgi:hypothetical protein
VKAKNLPDFAGEILRFAWGDMTTLRLTEYWYRLVVNGVTALFRSEVFDHDQHRIAEPSDPVGLTDGIEARAERIIVSACSKPATSIPA